MSGGRVLGGLFAGLLIGLVSAASAQVDARPEPEHELHFDLAGSCALCHASSPDATAMRDASGVPVAPFDLWRGTMMANSSRDPVWRAVLSAEIAATPAAKDAIEEKCLRCHAPMASAQAAFDGLSLGRWVLDHPGIFGLLARDGVSCTACHQIGPENLGTAGSFTGGYRIGHDDLIFGPHAEPIGGPMFMHSGFTPAHGEHVLQSGLCATCHTLVTEARHPDGSLVGQAFLEQAPFLEWRNSSYADGGERAATCQACHLPTTDDAGRPIVTRLAHNPGGFDFPFLVPRQPFGRHLLVGGNVLVPALLRDHAQELGVQAPRAAFEATLAATRRQLEQDTASLRLEALRLDASTLRGGVVVENRTGHALPTGHPSRRTWLRLRVRDAATGLLLWTSGEHDARGRLIDPAGRVLASEQAGGPGLPHLQVLSTPGQVQAWESLMADAHGGLTSVLLRAAKWDKNNRLLPHGWRADHPDASASAPRGVGGDPDFVAGRDRLELALGLGEVKADLRVEAELLYQPLSARYLAELMKYRTPEVERLERMLKTADLSPVVLARDEALLPRP